MRTSFTRYVQLCGKVHLFFALLALGGCGVGSEICRARING